MPKVTRHITIDPDVDEFIRKNLPNCSDWINERIREYMEGGSLYEEAVRKKKEYEEVLFKIERMERSSKKAEEKPNPKYEELLQKLRETIIRKRDEGEEFNFELRETWRKLVHTQSGVLIRKDKMNEIVEEIWNE